MAHLSGISKTCVAMAVCKALVVPGLAGAATVTVNSARDTVGLTQHDCTLRRAITTLTTNVEQGGCVLVGSPFSNATILFDLTIPTSIALTGGGLLLDGSFTIEGPGQSNLIINGANNSRVITVRNGSNIIKDLTVTGGSTGSGGGGIAAYDTALSLERVTVEDNQGGIGGGIEANNSTLTLDRVTIEENKALAGGGLFVNGGKLVANQITVSGNESTFSGGGIRISSANQSELVDSVISNNRANGLPGGGGVYIDYSENVTLDRVTLRQNTASEQGGGIFVRNSDNLSLNAGTIDGNFARFGGGAAV